MFFLFWILVLYGTTIIALTAATLRGKRGRQVAAPTEFPGVSVIIPFRNEKHNLHALLESLAGQSYKGEIEIILVNDQSEDDGVAVIETFRENSGRINTKIINLQLCSDTHLTSKQQALDLGVSQSSYPLLAFTDADMILAPNWIESLVDTQAATGAALVFGHTSIMKSDAGQTRKSALFAKFESYQLEFLFSFAYAFSKLGFTGSCMGNNILVTKESYNECGGQRGIGYSIVEDRALLEILRRKKYKTAAAEPFHTTASTYPSRTKTQFANQAMRWAAGGLRPGGGLFLAGLLFAVQNVVLLLSAIGVISALLALLLPSGDIIWLLTAILSPILIPIAAIIIANFLLTWLFLAITFIKNKSRASKLFYPVYYVFMMLEMAVLGVLFVFKRGKVRWKDRELRHRRANN